MKQLQINFRKTRDDLLAKHVMKTMEKGYKAAVRIQNKKARKKGIDAEGRVETVSAIDPHFGGCDVIVVGPDDFIDQEEKKLQESLSKLLVAFKTDPKLAKGFYHKFKRMSQEWMQRNMFKAYAIIGISIDSKKTEVN